MKWAAIAFSCLAPCADGIDGGLSARASVPRADVVVFDSALTQLAADALVAELRSRPRATLQMTSLGGNENAALDVAEYVEQNRVPLEIEKVCASACANSILIASPDVRLRPGSVIAFHHSAVSIAANYQKLAQPIPSEIERGALRLRGLYERRGVDLTLLTCSARMIGLTTQSVDVPVPGLSTPLKGWRTLKRWWLPQAETLSDFGVRWYSGQPTLNTRTAPAVLRSEAGLIAYGAADDCSDTRVS